MNMGAAKASTLVALLIAASVSAETAPTLDGGVDAPVLYDCPGSEEVAQKVDGGWFLTNSRADRVKCRLAALEKHRDELMRQNDELRAQPAAASWQTWAVVVVVTAAISFTVGYVVKK
jgi:hypothetical protein